MKHNVPDVESSLDDINQRLKNIEKTNIDDNVLNETTKDKIINALNEAIDIPIISEATERKILDAIVGTIYEVLREVIEGFRKDKK